MALIFTDGNDRGPRKARRHPTPGTRPVKSFRVRNAPIDRPDDRAPTEFGYHLLRERDAAGYRSNADLARAAGLGTATVSRLIYGGVGRPDTETLRKLAEALAPATPKTGRTDRVTAKHNELLHAAGYRIGDPPTARPLHPRALELDMILDPNGPLSDADREAVEMLSARLHAPYLEMIAKARRKRTG